MSGLPRAAQPPSPHLARLANGVRVLVLPMPWRGTVSASVFVRAGSLHENTRTSGISHLVEHMAFKGTATRDNRRINWDAERLGAEFTAHTDRDHTAFHLEGLTADLPDFVAQLADIVLHSRFPADELERERAVIAHEFSELDDDAVTLAFQLFDRAAWGSHPAGQPVIGKRANLARFGRDDLLAHVQRLYTGENTVLAVAGPLAAADIGRLIEDAQAHFGALAAGTPNTVAPPVWQGGLKLRRLAGSTQCHAVLGFEAPPLADPGHAAWQLAAAVLGEGMSSPLLEELRERRALAYHLGASADIGSVAGDLVVDASIDAAQAPVLLAEVRAMLERLGQGCGAELARARRQLQVRALRDAASATRRLEQGAQELFTLGRLRDGNEVMAALHDTPAAAVEAVFAQVLRAPAAMGFSGQVPPGLRERAAALYSLSRA